MNYTMSKLKPAEVAAGSGMIGFVRTIGIAFATSLITTEWHDAAIINRANVVDRLHGSHGLAQVGDIGIPGRQALGMIDHLVQDQAVMLATNDIYLALSVIVALLPVAIWIASPRRVKVAA
jgi:DHA2 family multidrug resistance protein